jgi:hypothetical protein
MGANIAGIYGAQIFREDDNPLYRRGFSVACAVLAFGIVLATFRYLDDLRRRRRDARRAPDVNSEGREDGAQKWQNVDSLSSASASPPNGEAALTGVGAVRKN